VRHFSTSEEFSQLVRRLPNRNGMTAPVTGQKPRSEWGTDEQELADGAKPADPPPLATARPQVVLDTERGVCEAPTRSETAVRKLASSAAKPHPSVAAAQRAKPDTFFARSYSDASGAGLEAGVVKHSDADSDAEFFTASVRTQSGETGQADLALTGAKVTAKGSRGSGTVEGLTVKSGVGTKNSDGSDGVNVSGGANLAATEVTFEASTGHSVTFGFSVGAGAAASVGERDRNRDGKPETCGRIEAGPVAVGGCSPALPDDMPREKVMP
jgi:hypothetical protein